MISVPNSLSAFYFSFCTLSLSLSLSAQEPQEDSVEPEDSLRWDNTLTVHLQPELPGFASLSVFFILNKLSTTIWDSLFFFGGKMCEDSTYLFFLHIFQHFNLKQ